MTETPTNVTPPPDLTYGYVDGRIILAIGDRSDGGRMPDPIPAEGLTVTFTPAATILKVTSPTPATVIKQPIVCDVDANGYLVDGQGARGVWLVTGTYKVTYSHSRAIIPSHDIEVTTGHTEVAPLDLTTAMPPGGPVLTPSEYAELNGRITILEAGGGGGGVTDHGALTGLADDDHPQYLTQGRGDERYVQGSDSRLTLADTAVQPADLTAYASDAELEAGLAGKSPVAHGHADPLLTPLVFRNRIYSTDYGAVSTASTTDAAIAQIGNRISGSWYSVREFGAVGDGVTDDTTAIQAALDGAMGTLYFPPGEYRVSGSGAACLNLTKNIDIVGANGRQAVIKATAGTTATSIFRVSFSENWGYGEVRNWRFANMTLLFSGTTYGKHALHIDGGYSIYTSDITNCWLTGRPANGGYAIYIDGHFYYSRISQCTLTAVYMASHDANTIEKCLINGGTLLPGVTFNLVIGVRNNTVRECTFTCNNEALHVTDGSNIRFINNQCEQVAPVSSSPHSSMVTIEGATMPAANIVISENNFGGGTNLDRLIYVDNADQTIIEKNNLISVGLSPGFAGKEIELTANAKYTVIRPDNFVTTQILNPRTRTAFRAEVLDNGVGTAGVLKTLATANGWTGGTFFKDAGGIVHFWETLSGGTLTAGTLIGTLPVGFRPPGTTLRYMNGGSSGGTGSVTIDPTNGEIKVSTMPAGSKFVPPPFPAATTATA